MSFVSSARQVIAQRQKLKLLQEEGSVTKDRMLIREIPSRLLQFLKQGKMRNVCQLIAEFHGIDDLQDDTKFLKEILTFRHNIGYIKRGIPNKLKLFYEKPGYYSEELEIDETQVLAVEYLDIFDLSIYFVPYKDEKDGFACVIVAPFSEAKLFLDDIPSDACRDLVVKYLEHHPNLTSE